MIWGANANSPTTAPYSVNDGEVRAFLGNGDGTFVLNSYYVSSVLHNAGTLLADIGADAGSLTAGDVDGDGDVDVVAGGSDGAVGGYLYIRLLRNFGGAVHGREDLQPLLHDRSRIADLLSGSQHTEQPVGVGTGRRGRRRRPGPLGGRPRLYVYLYLNNGAGMFTPEAPDDAATAHSP